jgi:hypothetical protein
MPIVPLVPIGWKPGVIGHPRKRAAGHLATAFELYFAVRAGPARPTIPLYFRGQRVVRILPVF